MNIDKMKKATAKQAESIRNLACFEEVKHEFALEYKIAQELVNARKVAHLTQAEIAAAMGTTQSVVSRIENGANVSVETIARYARACGKQLDVHVI